MQFLCILWYAIGNMLGIEATFMVTEASKLVAVEKRHSWVLFALINQPIDQQVRADDGRSKED